MQKLKKIDRIDLNPRRCVLPATSDLIESRVRRAYEKFLPLQSLESYNLSQVLDQVKKAGMSHPGD